MHTVDSLLELLRGGRGADLIGAAESLTVEFKAEPYRLELARQRQELAKDLSALANAQGGAIAIGFKTQKDPGRATDEVVEARPFPRAMFDEDQWRKIAAEWVYPPIERLAFEWYDAPDDKGFLVLRVPEQRSSVGPFLVTRAVGDEDRVDGVIFGMFERCHTDAAPLSVSEVHTLLRDGRVFRTAIDQRSVTARAADVGSVGIPPQSVEATLGRAARLIDLVRLAEHPTYVLTATPHPPLPARQMFAASDHPVITLMHRSPELRSSGFDLDTGRYPDIIGGESRRSLVAGYKGKELWSDGTLVFVGTADADFLGWGNRTPEAPIIVNQVALIESVYLFSRLFVEVWKQLGSPEVQVEFALHLARMCPSGKPPVLRPGPLGPRGYLSGARQAPACEFHQRELATNPLDPSSIAFALVARLYEWFGFEHDRIPYAANERIEPTQIAKI